MVFKLWEKEDDWTEIGDFNVPESFIAATKIFIILKKGEETPGDFNEPRIATDKERIAELSNILLSISGGADEIGKKENETLFTIDKETVLGLDDRIRNDKESLALWKEHVDKGTLHAAYVAFAQQIILNNRSPYEFDVEDGKIVLEPNDPRKEVLEEFANEWYRRVRAVWYIAASQAEVDEEAGILSGSG
ncbi:hypothetical protein MMC14_003544 [Varicellaria rhodocarpa]|nr:hypothetical protein [Varicellaria rhodocarpa]